LLQLFSLAAGLDSKLRLNRSKNELRNSISGNSELTLSKDSPEVDLSSRRYLPNWEGPQGGFTGPFEKVVVEVEFLAPLGVFNFDGPLLQRGRNVGIPADQHIFCCIENEQKSGELINRHRFGQFFYLAHFSTNFI